MAVTRCVCYPHTFREIRELAQQNEWTTVTEISINLGCGLGCHGCRPYLQAMLDTGATSFAVRRDDKPPQPCAPESWDIQ